MLLKFGYYRFQKSIEAGRIQWHSKALLKFKQRIRLLTNRNWGVSISIIGFGAECGWHSSEAERGGSGESNEPK